MARRVPAGEMRHPVSIVQHKIDSGTTAYDSYGQVSATTTAWTEIASGRAAIEQLSGTEAEIARQVYPKATYRVTVDYSSVLDSTGGSRRSVRFGSRYLHIGGMMNPDLENVQLQLLCSEER